MTIRYESTPGSVFTGELASYLGYLPGIKVKSEGVSLGGPQSIQAVATGATDLALAANGSIIAAVASGAKLEAVVDSDGINDKNYSAILVKKDSSIHSAKDLIGKTVGVNTLGANATQVTDLWLTKEGLTPAQIKQVEFVVVSQTEAGEALATGRVDAVFLSVQQLGALKRSQTRTLMTDVGFLGPYTRGTFVLRPSFIQQHQAETKELVAGLAKADHWLQVTPRAKVISVFKKIEANEGRSADDKVIEEWQSQGIAEPYGYIEPKDFTEWVKPLEEAGQLKPGQVNISKIWTNKYNPYAPR